MADLPRTRARRWWRVWEVASFAGLTLAAGAAVAGIAGQSDWVNRAAVPSLVLLVAGFVASLVAVVHGRRARRIERNNRD